MRIGTLYLFFTNNEGIVFVTTGKQILPIREEQKEVMGGYDWENVIYPLISQLCGRKIAKCVDYANLQVAEVANGKNKKSFVVKIYLPQLKVEAELFSKNNGLVVVKEEELKNIIKEDCVIRRIKAHNDIKETRREVRMEETHKKICLKAFTGNLILDRVSPFDGVIFFILISTNW